MIFIVLPIVAAVMQTVQVPAAYLSAQPAAETVLAKVDGVPIRAVDVDRLLWDYSGYEVTQDLIWYQLVHEEAAKRKVGVTPAEVQKAYEDFADQQKTNLQPGENLDSMLRRQGLPKSRIKIQLESNLLMNKMVDPDFKPADFVKVSTMVFKPKSGVDTDLQISLGQAHDAYTRLTKKGESWEKVVNSSGQPDPLIQHDGLLGWRQVDVFPAGARAELKGAKDGFVTKPEQTASGIQIFRIEEFGANAKGKDLDELRGVFEQAAKNALARKIQASAKIEQLFGKTAQK